MTTKNNLFRKPRYGWSNGEPCGPIEWRAWACWTAALIAAIAILFGAVVGLRTIDHTITRGHCENYADQTGAAADFKEFGFFDYGCYVRTDQGWVLREDIVKVED